MKIIIKKVKNILKNNFFRLLLEMTILTLLFNLNIILGMLLLLILLIEIIICKEIKSLLYVFVFLSFNDEILKVDLLSGSISKIVIVFIIIKLLIYILKNKIKPNKFHIGIITFFLLSCLISLGNYGEMISILINVISVVLMSMCIRPKNKKEMEVLIEQICLTILISVLCSVLYGFLTMNFLVYVQDEKIMYRFNGSYEPNFMSLFINLAIISLITIKEKIKFILVCLIFSILVCANILTVSITGIMALLIILVIYFVFYIKEWKKIVKLLLVVSIISASLLFFINILNLEKIILNNKKNNIDLTEIIETEDDDEILIENNKHNKKNNIVEDGIIKKQIEESKNSNSLENRIKRILKQIKNLELDEITSGRTSLIRSFIKASFNRPIINILFGNNPTNKKVFNDFFQKECFSHNSIVDLFYNFGIIGFTIIIVVLTTRFIKNIFINNKLLDNKYSKNIKLIRLLLVIYALSLSLYTKRIILVFFLL